jgi:hypothetical protein
LSSFGLYPISAILFLTLIPISEPASSYLVVSFLLVSSLSDP